MSPKTLRDALNEDVYFPYVIVVHYVGNEKIGYKVRNKLNGKEHFQTFGSDEEAVKFIEGTRSLDLANVTHSLK